MAQYDAYEPIFYGVGSGMAGRISGVRTDPPDQGRSAFTAFGSRSRAGEESGCFFEAFDIKDGDEMFLAPAKRVTIW